MPFDSLYLKNFRLYKEKRLKISTVNTLITGPNGSGKTTLLESINILLTGKSFRTNYLQECVREGEKRFFLKLDSKRNWTKFDGNELMMNLLLETRGVSDELCVWKDCKNPALNALAYCVYHAYGEIGIRK